MSEHVDYPYGDGPDQCDQHDHADPGDMDGDHESGLASAGWGVDEDYVADDWSGMCDEW